MNALISTLCKSTAARWMFIVTFLGVLPVPASAAADAGKSKPPGFIENRGQMTDMAGRPVPFVLFKLQGSGADIYLTEKGLSYVFRTFTETRAASPEQSYPEGQVAWERVDLNLEGASIRMDQVLKEEAGSGSIDYYLGHCPDGIRGVKRYGKLTVKNIYPGIDWVLYNAGDKGMKYDFVLQPGADPSLLKLVYVSREKMSLQKNGMLSLKKGLVDLSEQAPKSFQGGIEIGSRFRLSGFRPLDAGGYESRISFGLDAYDPGKTLVIDPILNWGTTFGGGFDDVTSSTDLDANGNLYIAGFSLSSNFPVQGTGSYFQGTNSGSADAFVLKFSNAGVLIWSTYYGGNNPEGANSVYVDQGGHIYVTGSTYSSNFPLQNAGTFFQALAGPGAVDDAFILHFDNNGNRLWATCYGGTAADIGTSISTDASGNIVVCGATTSLNFPLHNAGTFFQPAYGGNWDGFVMKFSNAGARLWATYVGGGGYDRANSLVIDASGNTIMIGESASGNFPLLNTGAFFQGSVGLPAQDAFITKFTPAGILLFSSFYGGSGMEYASGLVLDKAGNVFVTGHTESPNFPVQNGGGFFQSARNGFSDAFVIKFDAAFNRQWATYFGGKNADYYFYNQRKPAIDACGNLLLAMSTESPDVPDQPDCTPGGGYQSGTGPTVNCQLHVSQWSTNGDLLWSTYMGYDVMKGAGSIEIDSSGSVFVATSSSGANHMQPYADPGNGAYYSTSDGYGVYVAKFVQPPPFFSYLPIICLTDTNRLLPVWSSGSAPGCLNTGTYTANGPGITVDPVTGEIDLSSSGIGTYSISYTGCAGKAGATITLTSGTTPLTAFSYVSPLCQFLPDQSPLLGAGFTTGGTFSGSAGLTVDPLTGTIDMSSATPGTYVVSYSVAPHACFKAGHDSTVIVITNATDPVLGFSYTEPVCPSSPDLWPQSVAGSSTGGTYAANTGLVINASTGQVDVGASTPGTYTVTYTLPQSGCTFSGTAIASLVILPGPPLSLSANVSMPPGGSVALVASSAANLAYTWTPDADLSCSDCPAPMASPSENTLYCVIANDGKCINKACVMVEIVCPGHGDLSTPNAFTPNGDGINDAFCLQGWESCLRDFVIRIYDQWGEKVFESTDASFCWDGRYRGRALDPAVFVYQIKASYSNGQVVRKGNISLLR